jgi:hypothetical protein
MLNLKDIQSNEARRQEMIRQAEQERLAKLTQGKTKAQLFLYRSALSWTGRRLVILGNRMLVLSRDWDYNGNPLYNSA